MIQKKLKKLLDYKDKRIFDIILYGSYVRGKEGAQDIDVVVLFTSGTLRERLDTIQKLKPQVTKLLGRRNQRFLAKLVDIKLDIKQMLLSDLFSTVHMARTGILLEGISLVRKKSLCEVLGFRAYALFSYNLKNLSHSAKVKFNYLLAGRNTEGLIKQFNGKRVVNGAIKIPYCRSDEFEGLLIENQVRFVRSNILEQI